MKGRCEDVHFSACECLGQLVLSYYYVTERAAEEGEVRLPLDATHQDIAEAICTIVERRQAEP